MSKKMAGGTPRLWLVIFKSFWKRFAIQALITFVEVNLISSQLLFSICNQLETHFSISSIRCISYREIHAILLQLSC